jgi:flagellar hook-associated protein 1 FlgK
MASQPNSKVTVAPSLDTATALAHALAGNGDSGLTIDVSGAANDLQNYGLTAANFISVAPTDPNLYMNGSTPIISSLTANAVSKMGNVFGDAVASLTSDVGNQVATWTNTQKSDTAVLNNLTTQFNSISGVNLDEEAANLLKYQQLYAASSKVLQTGNQMFSALLAIMN